MNRLILTSGHLLAGAMLTVPLLAQKETSPTDRQLAAFHAGPEWREFLDRDPAGSWRVEWCAASNSPRAIYGSGLALSDWSENTLEAARQQAHRLLRDHAGLLRLGSSDFRESIGARMGRTWSFTFDQYHRNVPVLGGRADVRVNMAGRVPMIGATAFPIAADFDVVPAFDAETATAIAWQQLGQPMTGVAQPAPLRAPRLVIHTDVQAEQLSAMTLAFEVHVSNVGADGQGPIGRYYIDAKTGAVLQFVSDKHDCGVANCGAAHANSGAKAAPPVNTTVTVMGWTRTGIDGLDPLVNVPLPGLVLNVPGIGQVTTDNNGQFTINIAAAVSIPVGNLDGRHHAPVTGANAISSSFTVNPGVATTIQLLTAGASFNQGAHTTMSYWIDRTNQYCRAILGNTAELNTASAVVPAVNIASTCNAYYVNNTLNFYQAGGGCSNTAFSTIIAHEWGHGLDDRYGGISNNNGDGLSEGWGDIVGMYVVDNLLLGSGFFGQGIALRRGDNNRQYGSVQEIHDAGESWMGFAWNLRDRLTISLGTRAAAIAQSNTIVIGSIVADAQSQPSALLEVFIADDNDGNLANGTPHSADITWSANNHSIPVPITIANDSCAGAIAVQNGLNGPFSNAGADTSAPAWACGPGTADLWFSYAASGAGTLTVTTCGQAGFDTVIEVFTGNCGALSSVACNDDAPCGLQSSVSVPVAAGTYRIRVGGYNNATGSFSINVTGPQGGAPAAVTSYGAGCMNGSKAFYELFTTASSFDLSGSAMRLVRNGNSYIAQPGGTYVAPTGAAVTLALGDDAFVSVPLSGTLVYPGGSTSSLEVCSNGFVSAATGNGAPYDPLVSTWLASTAFRWGTWHDFNPTLVGSGQVKFQQIGQVAYVTWAGVYSHTTTNANTWQLQFDLATGNVTMVWPTMVGSGNAFLVGVAGVAPNADLGSRDISATLPGTFRTQSSNTVPLALASTLPHIGSTVTLTTTQFPATATLGVQILSTVILNPGTDLTSIGMPGCLLSVNLDVLSLLVAIGGQATSPLTVPNNPTLIGTQIGAQSAAFYGEANAFGMVTSNGMRLSVGI